MWCCATSDSLVWGGGSSEFAFPWDEDGFVIIYKRLEQGAFHFPAAAAGQAGVTLRAAELAMLLGKSSRLCTRRSSFFT
jgi:hypothetical protein